MNYQCPSELLSFLRFCIVSAKYWFKTFCKLLYGISFVEMPERKKRKGKGKGKGGGKKKKDSSDSKCAVYSCSEPAEVGNWIEKATLGFCDALKERFDYLCGDGAGAGAETRRAYEEIGRNNIKEMN